MTKEANWYVVFTKARQELIAKAQLENQQFIVYLPLLKHYKRLKGLYQIVSEALFSRYIFVSSDSTLNEWEKIRSTRGCISIVRFGNKPALVPACFIEQLKAEENNKKTNSSPSEFKVGDAVSVASGFPKTYREIIYQKNSYKRVSLLLDLSEKYTRNVNVSVHNTPLITNPA